MINNFLQKPLGIVTVLTAAVGGPYAAFETDLGTSLRRGLVSIQSAASDPSSQGANEVLPQASDPASLAGLYGSNPASFGSNAHSTGASSHNGIPQYAGQQYNGQPYAAPIFGQKGAGSQSVASQTVPSQVVSTVYGPTTIYPLEANHPGSQVAGYSQGYQPPSPNLENRSGPAVAIPGSTHQLWDYTLGTPTLPQLQQQHPQATVGGGAISDLREVLRFDIVPGWLPQRFARVTTVTSNVKMDGLRVPLITGTQPKDIAGSLTYYFDASQSLKRINLHGLTGDPTQLANLMVQFYQLKPEQSLGGQLFTVRWNNRITSVMQIAPAPIIYAGADHSKYIIFLELNQPSNEYGLSDEASEILRSSQATQRW
jgi:hypothetical protein